MRVPFTDLSSQNRRYSDQLHLALDRVINHGEAILGPEVRELEGALAKFVSRKYCCAVANGTDALVLSLKSMAITSGEVITTPMSYLASTSAIVMAGATPVFADVGLDLNLDPLEVERAITKNTRAILVVHLAGNPARIQELQEIASQYGLKLIEDCAQAFGATSGAAVGSFGHISAVSFHPLKNLGALGDAGAIFTDDEEALRYLRLARNHGHSSRDQCEFWSVNSRLDSLQAGFLLAFLEDYSSTLALRRAQARRYIAGLADYLRFPVVNDGAQPSYNFFYVLSEQRDQLVAYLASAGVEARIHYPTSIPNLTAAKGLARSHLPMADNFTKEILSLPMGKHISDSQLDWVIDVVRRFYGFRGCV